MYNGRTHAHTVLIYTPLGLESMCRIVLLYLEYALGVANSFKAKKENENENKV